MTNIVAFQFHKTKHLMQISNLNISILSPRNLHQITTHFESNQSVS